MQNYLESVDIDWFNQRLVKVLIAFLIAFAFLAARLVYLQVIDGKKLRHLSEINSIRIQDIDAPRGLILDRNGMTLVENRPSFNLYIIPKDAKPLEVTLERLSYFLDEPLDELTQKVKGGRRRGPYTPILISEDMPRDTLAALEVHKFRLPGVVVRVFPRRHYLHDALAAHVLGYMGEISADELQSSSFRNCKGGDYIGKFGVEKAFEAELRGRRGGRQVEVNAVGQVERVLSQVPAQPGLDISLTIDAGLQEKAEQLLAGHAGALVAVGANNGDILAMASSPSFNPNDFVIGLSQDKWQSLVNNPFRPLENKAFQAEYPPASTYKLVTAIAGLEEGVIDLDTSYYCPGHYTYGNRTYRCWKRGGHGAMDILSALAQSCDVYFYQVGEALGVDRLAQYAQEFGLGAPTKLNLDREAKGLIPTSQWKLKAKGEPWQGGETLSIAIGQGFNLVTPLQMAILAATVGNGGTRYKPNIIHAVHLPGESVRYSEPTVAKQLLLSKETLSLVHQGLWEVVNQKRGTAYAYRLPTVAFSGKTGTAQVVSRVIDHTDAGDRVAEIPKDHAWFVAYAPSENPVIAVAVIVEHGEHGSSAAAPIAREIIRLHLQLPEDNQSAAIEKAVEERINQVTADDD